MSRREAWASAALVFIAAVAVRAWAATIITFPRPEDTAYYVGVARHLVEGRGLVSDAIWSYGTPPLEFPRPAFEVWLPLPSFLAALSMLVFGTSFAAAQGPSIVIGGALGGPARGGGGRRGPGGARPDAPGGPRPPGGGAGPARGGPAPPGRRRPPPAGRGRPRARR